MNFFLIILFITLGLSQDDTIKKAQDLYNSKAYKNAIKMLQDIIDKDDEHHEAYYLLGKCYIEVEDYESAVDALEEATDLNPNHVDYQLNYGIALYRNANNVSMISLPFYVTKIEDAFEKTLELDPNNIEAMYGLAKYKIVAPGLFGGDKEKAKEMADYIMTKDSIKGTKLLFDLYYRDFQYSKAETYLLKLKKMNFDISEYYSFYNRYGYHLIREDQIEASLIPFQKQIDMEPEQYNPYDSMAEAYLLLKNYEKAKYYYALALSKDPNMKTEENMERILDIDSEFGPYLRDLFR